MKNILDDETPFISAMNSEFNWKKYQGQLSTNFLGKIVIFSKVVNSTFDLLEGAKPLKHGLAVIASRQIKGKVWLVVEFPKSLSNCF